jgi:hypothetical protein
VIAIYRWAVKKKKKDVPRLIDIVSEEWYRRSTGELVHPARIPWFNLLIFRNTHVASKIGCASTAAPVLPDVQRPQAHPVPLRVMRGDQACRQRSLGSLKARRAVRVPNSMAHDVCSGTRYDRHASRTCELTAVMVHGTPLLSLMLFTACELHKTNAGRLDLAVREIVR